MVSTWTLEAWAQAWGDVWRAISLVDRLVKTGADRRVVLDVWHHATMCAQSADHLRWMQADDRRDARRREQDRLAVAVALAAVTRRPSPDEAAHYAGHDALKRSPAWSELPYVGVLPGCDGEPDVELRNCPACESTLGRELEGDL